MYLNDSQYYFILDTSMNLLSKKQLTIEKAKEIEAITNSLVKEIDVLKKKVDALKESLKEDEHLIR